MPTTEQVSHQPTPIIGRIVHWSIQLVGIAGPVWFGWELSGGGVPGTLTALLFGAAFGILWLGVYAPVDPEPNPLGFLPVRGRLRFVLEIALIIAGGSALWIAWSRAAGETFLTAAFIDLAVRYPRQAILFRN